MRSVVAFDSEWRKPMKADSIEATGISSRGKSKYILSGPGAKEIKAIKEGRGLGHNFHTDLARWALIDPSVLDAPMVRDTRVGAACLDIQNNSLELLARRFLKKSKVELDVKNIDDYLFKEHIGERAQGDAELIEQLWERMEERVENVPASKVLFMQVPVLANLHLQTIYFDTDALSQLRIGWRNKMGDIVRQFQDQGYHLNPGSPDQTLIFFAHMGIYCDGTNADELTNLLQNKKLKPDQRQIIKDVIEYRQTARLLSSKEVLANPRWSYIRTLRLSSSPNVQNIPTVMEEAIHVPAGRTLLGFDYSQIELRVAAWISEDPVMRKVFENNGDIHSETQRAFDPTMAPENRRPAKTFNFGLGYGAGVDTLFDQLQAQGIDCTMAQVKERMEKIQRLYRRFFAWRKHQVERARFKRIIAPHGIKWDLSETPNAAGNYPIQSFASFLCHIGSILVFRCLRSEFPDVCFKNYVHDSYWLETADSQKDVLTKRMLPLMEKGVPQALKETMGIDFDLPLKVDVKPIGIGAKEKKECFGHERGPKKKGRKK